MFIVIFTKLVLLRSVIIIYTDYIDIVVDHVPHSEYKEEEDPHIHNSKIRMRSSW